MSERYDLVVVGGGPAGSAAALRALQLRPDAKVLILDAADFPRDKTCGDGVSAYSLDLLERLGAGRVTTGYPPVHLLQVRSPHGRVVLGTPARPNRIVPRLVLDRRLLDRARALGAELARHRVRRIEQRADCVILDGEIAARAVVAADGANSTVRRQLGFSRNRPSQLAIAVRGYAPLPPAPDPRMVIAIEERDCPAYAWSFPIGDGRANVGFGIFARRAIDKVELWQRLADALPDQPADPRSLRAHYLPLSTERPRQPDGRVLLAGDAASLVNPITGEGIHYALLSGMLAGEAAESGRYAGRRYRRSLRAALGRHLRHTSFFARLVRDPRFLDGALATAERRPEVFDTIVDLGLGDGRVGAGAFAAVGGEYLKLRRSRVVE